MDVFHISSTVKRYRVGSWSLCTSKNFGWAKKNKKNIKTRKWKNNRIICINVYEWINIYDVDQICEINTFYLIKLAHAN